MDFAKRLEHLMQKDGITKYRLSKLVGCSATTVTNWLNGTAPTGEYLQKLSDIFGVSVDYLIGKEIQTKKDPAENSGVTDEDIKFALFGGGDVTDEQFEEVKQFARFIQERDAAKAAQQKN